MRFFNWLCDARHVLLDVLAAIVLAAATCGMIWGLWELVLP